MEYVKLEKSTFYTLNNHVMGAVLFCAIIQTFAQKFLHSISNIEHRISNNEMETFPNLPTLYPFIHYN